MANLTARVNAELENIERALTEIPSYDKLHKLSTLELAGVATFLHNFYNGIENILKQILIDRNIQIPELSTWHRDLLNIAAAKNIISDSTKISLGEYLAFRHFFSHSYALDLYPYKMEPLVEKVDDILKIFQSEISKSIQ